MKSKKVVIGSIAVACVAGLLTITAMTGAKESEQETASADAKGIAGIASVFNDYELEMAEETDNWLTVVEQDVAVVAASYTEEASEEADTEDTEAADSEATEEAAEEEESTEAELTEEEQEWQQYLMADVKEFLYIREEASEDSEAVGKLYKGDRALIKGTEGEWTLIASGSVTGYVKTEYCVIGTDALAYAKANCDLIATVTGKTLRVRKEQSTDSTTITTVSKGSVLTVDTDAETSDEWVAVIVNSNTYYVSAEYVELSYDTGKAVSIEEEEAAKAAAAATQSSSGSSSSSSESTSASTDELTLLAALIQCEAGGESYKCQVSVGAVVLNRVASSRFPNSITKVIYQSGQFGPASNGSLARRLNGTISSTAYAAAKEALAGTDYTDGCLYFNDTSHTSHSGLQMGSIIFW